MPESLLEISDLRIAFAGSADGHEAVSGVSLQIGRGELVALVGESGSGKTLTALSIARLLPLNAVRLFSGSVRFNGEDLMTAPETRLRELRGSRIAYIFQEPGTALNPVFTAGYQIGEAIKLHRRDVRDVQGRIHELLQDVGIREVERVACAYPHQLSGGQQQRVMIAIALACEPDLLIADEPTTALDVTVQAQILDLLKSLQQKYGMSLMLITHNLAIAAKLADRMVVMYAGQVVEQGPVRQVMQDPRHPYTRALLVAVPRMHGERRAMQGIPGQIPSGVAWPIGCRFNPRCEIVSDRCRQEAPALMTITGEQRRARCFYANGSNGDA